MLSGEGEKNQVKQERQTRGNGVRRAKLKCTKGKENCKKIKIKRSMEKEKRNLTKEQRKTEL